MRVLVGMPTKGARGGINACEVPFIEALKRQGVEVSEEVYSYDDNPSNPVRRISRVLGTARRLRRRMRAERFDIIHLNTSFDLKAILRDATIVFLLRGNHGRIFLKFHGSDPRVLQESHSVLRRVTHKMFSRVDGVGVLSSEERDNFVRACVPEGKLFIVKNAVEGSRSERDPEFAKRWNVDANSPALLFISRFIAAKGLVDVIRACRIVRDRGYKFTLLCVGDGPARSEAEEEVSRAALQSNVRFFGFLDEKQANEFYANTTMLLFPTYHIEGFSMVIFNAVANGLPIITTRMRAAADYLREPDNVYWVEPKNPEMLAEKILRLIDDTTQRSTMALKNRTLAKRFSADIVASEYLSIYQQMVRPKMTEN